ncbi:hypothetical protein BpHYR1_033037 [Brachionus plicatilis]|uniref:Uncharacterized protein n=1 Tax=Brachionus plicatilis TaxID=10195 RepID=A0A3M7TB44_BRAPC|nr:hypothetical protein BpHYR1_033037 [Brachionus plicatilis]
MAKKFMLSGGICQKLALTSFRHSEQEFCMKFHNGLFGLFFRKIEFIDLRLVTYKQVWLW